MRGTYSDEYLESLNIQELNAFIKTLKVKIKDIKKHLLVQKTNVEIAKQERSHMAFFEDCGDFYINEHKLEESKFDDLLRYKISTEKYLKKAKHILMEKSLRV